MNGAVANVSEYLCHSHILRGGMCDAECGSPRAGLCPWIHTEGGVQLHHLSFLGGTSETVNKIGIKNDLLDDTSSRKRTLDHRSLLRVLEEPISFWRRKFRCCFFPCVVFSNPPWYARWSSLPIFCRVLGPAHTLCNVGVCSV